MKCLAGDITSRVRGKQQGKTNYIIRIPDASQRYPLDELLELGLRHQFQHRGIDHPRCDDINPDPGGTDLSCQTSAEAFYAGFFRRVVRAGFPARSRNH